MSPRLVATLVAGAALVMAALSCTARSHPDLLPGAVYASSTVSVYPNALLVHVTENESHGDEPDAYTQGLTWYFTVRDSRAKVMAFYEKQFPGAERTTQGDGSVTFRIVPPGAGKNEDVQVTVGDGEIRIAEHSRPGKIRS